MSNIKYNRRNILIALVIIFLIATFVHITLLRPYFDWTSSDWFRSFKYQSKEWWRDNPDVVQPEMVVERPLELEEIHGIINKTNGYFVRDWSLWLGWNNVRYIIEAAVLQAQLLNRTLVIPSYIYARGCEFHIESCAAYYNMVNRNDALGSKEWRNLPIKEQMGWKIPISDMLDLPLLRSRHPTILVSEFLRIHGLPEDIERSKGNWDRERYHEGNYMYTSLWGNQNADGKPSLYVIHNDWYDDDLTRVDSIPEEMKVRGGWDTSIVDSDHGQTGGFRNVQEDSVINKKLTSVLDLVMMSEWGTAKLDWEVAKNVLREVNGLNVDDDEEVGNILRENGWEVLYTYLSHGGTEFMKSVAIPIYQTAPRSRLRGFKEDFAHITEDVLLLEGETHVNRKSGQVEFTTRSGLDFFTTTVLHYIVPPPRVYHIADKLAERMSEKVGGRMWMGAHMRRGDFARLHWVMESSIKKHLERVKGRLENGRKILTDLHSEKIALEPFDVPDVVADTRVLTLEPPIEDDPFYVATDERDAKSLHYLSSNNVVLISDLLTPALRREFGYRLMVTDILALVEQVLMSRADFFYGHVMSSVAGGIFNMRAREGKDHRCSLTE